MSITFATPHYEQRYHTIRFYGQSLLRITLCFVSELICNGTTRRSTETGTGTGIGIRIPRDTKESHTVRDTIRLHSDQRNKTHADMAMAMHELSMGKKR